MIPAQKDSYKRVYREDGTFHYPKVAENILRKKGNLYFQSMDVTGSSEGTTKDPKFPLLQFFERTELPALEERILELNTESPGRKFVVRYQMIGVGRVSN